MRNWDQILMLLLGLGVAAYTAIRGWRLWHKVNPLAGIGLYLLGLSAVLVPVLLALWRS